MTLSLRAEQKSVLNIFKIEEQYVIPPYQRPYSWEYDQCYQLYNDILASFRDNKDYFIGNLVIAKGDSNKGFVEIVDGQQRLVTLMIFIKVLSLFQKDFLVLDRLLTKEDWKGGKGLPRLKSEVFETNDDKYLREILDSDEFFLENLFTNSYSNKLNRILERKVSNKFLLNTMYFYQWIKFYSENNSNLEEFISHLLQNIYLLPIELSGITQEDANEKALTIFETLNNRGMNLEDADIFKAKLFNKAKNVNESSLFIKQWTDFKINCDNLNLTVDDIFRYYSHIIRGRLGITSYEKKLRDFFKNENTSPLELKRYQEVLDDLFKIIEIIQFINIEKDLQNEHSPWLQVLDAYPNQYPKYAIVNYLFVNGMFKKFEFTKFLKSLIKFVYFQGATSTIKFEMYNIIKNISQNNFIQLSTYQINDYHIFDNLRRLQKGFALLQCYLLKSETIPNYFIERLISYNDRQFLPYWPDNFFYSIFNDISNLVVTQRSYRSIPFKERMDILANERELDLQDFIKSGFNYLEFLERSNRVKEKLANFFQSIDE